MNGFPTLQVLNGLDGMIADSLGDTGASPYAYGHVVPSGPYRAQQLGALSLYNPAENAPYRFYSRGRGDNASVAPTLEGLGATTSRVATSRGIVTRGNVGRSVYAAAIRSGRRSGLTGRPLSRASHSVLRGLNESYATGIYSGNATAYGVPAGRSNMPTLGDLPDLPTIGKAAVLVGAGVLLAPWIKKVLRKVL